MPEITETQEGLSQTAATKVATKKPKSKEVISEMKTTKVLSKYALRPVASSLIPLINARFPVIAVSTDDEDRMFETEKAALTQAGVAHIYTWNATGTLKEENSQETTQVRNMRELAVWFAKRTPDGHKVATSKDLVDQAKFAPNKSALFIFDGEFFLQKPGKIRFDYNPPSPIELIADGSSVVVRDRKLANLAASGDAAAPEVIVSANIGCITHLQSGTNTPVKHWIEVLDEALTRNASGKSG